MSIQRSMREDLIAYALGELDDTECQRIERALADSEALRDELEQVKRCLADVECSELDDEIPSDLADRTTAGIFSGCWDESDQGDPAAANSFSAIACIMSPVDMTVALGVLITIGSLLTPALYNSRNAAQTASCANNLRQLGQLLQMYAERNMGFFPVVRPTEHAGVFAPRLREADFVRDDVFDPLFLCPGSPLAEQLYLQGRTFHVPSMAELSLAKGMLRVELQRISSGSYGYQPGYSNGKFYLPMKNRENSLVPIVADAPSMADNYRISANHGGKVVNVLFQSGSVLPLASPEVPCSNDALYLNDEGRPAVGTHWNDAVVLPSGATPGVEQQFMPEAVIRLIPLGR